MLTRYLLKDMGLRDMDPRVCGIHNCGPGETMPRHHIQRFVIHYTLEGKGSYLVDDRAHSLEPGDLFLSRPGCVTSYLSDPETPLRYIWVSFNCGTAFSGLLNRDILHAPWAGEIFEKILAAGPEPGAEWEISGLLLQFFARLQNLEPDVFRKDEDYITRALTYIHANYSEELRVSELAEELGLSRSYFCRLFKSRTSMSPQAYLVSYRLDMAAKEMVEQGISQKEAALRAGYGDVCSFSRMFRKKYGVSPGAYRRDHQRNSPEYL